jgi:phosphoesterase RecJ-like protein
MELSPKAQSVELIRNSQNILILTHEDPDGDAVGSSLALSSILKKLGKTADLIFYGQVASYLEFLPGAKEVQSALESTNEIVISIDTSNTGENLRLGHKKLEDKHQVMIVVSPPKGILLPEDITVTKSRPKYDLIIILDCSSLERVGPIAQEMPDLFFETPTISIDHHPTNSYFAKVNWVDMTAAATSEMLVSLFESLGRGENLLDGETATNLLTGLTTDTMCFRNGNTTPKALTVAAQLVAAGANQQEIIDKIYRTKPLSTLKLWGKALLKLEEDTAHRFAWSSVSEKEIMEIGAEAIEVKDVVDEILKSAAGVDFVILLYEKDGQVHGGLRSVSPSFDVTEIAKLFNGGGHKLAAGFSVTGTLEEQQEEILQKIRAFSQAVAL